MRVHSLRLRSAFIFIAAISILAIGIQPIFVGLVAAQLELTLSQQSLMISAEMGGAMVGTLLCLPMINRLGLRSIALIFSVGLLISNSLMATALTFDVSLLLRALSGLCSGVLYSLAVFSLGRLYGPDRSFGILLLFQTAVFSLMAGALPAVWESQGYVQAVGMLCAWFLLVVVACLAVPRRLISSEPEQTLASASGSSRLGVIALIGMLLLQIAIYSLWGFIEGIGAQAGISSVDIGLAISIGLLGGLPGAALPSVFGGRVGRAPMIIFGSVIVLLAFSLLARGIDQPWQLMLAVFLMNFGWTLALAYYMASVAVNDPQNNLGKLVGLVQITAAAVAPAILSVAIEGNDRQAIFTLSITAICFSVLVGLLMLLGSRTTVKPAIKI
ncbi:MFS transporter [Pseudomonas sp. S75]|uniref:MFS transporter n=1 Tax=unclassified Pseudomonas TaxID=196821 RepID=UPI00190492AB|nr:MULTISPECIES: MFS transporter [unclassified Pseudomonas]MBJ9974186.1 MFS transporter [Pseudomonas sp. S30]MBK0151884.1 MFS transporter [Pseudomonas sp. S75]